MILKRAISREGIEVTAWEFIDGISEVQVYTSYVKTADETISGESKFVRYLKGAENLAVTIDEGAYLLNDEGKTIERLS